MSNVNWSSKRDISHCDSAKSCIDSKENETAHSIVHIIAQGARTMPVQFPYVRAQCKLSVRTHGTRTEATMRERNDH